MDPEEFDRQFRALYTELHRWLIKRMSNEDDADDVLQLTAVAALRGLPSYTNQNFRAWVFQIARNESIDFWKRRGRQSRLRQRLKMLAEPDSIEPETDLLEEMSPHLAAAMDAIPPLNRRALELAVLHNKTYAQIAAMEDVTEATVMSRIYRAKDQLRRRLEDFDYKSRILK